ncbi:helix-turn-helix transcriptional regulator [Ectothiorhodospiraceae bacterium WFHF3C12]|nr:helix-turn-helix transcriptional regulator [Ectothiorhodospiraceae bacterium WFHF3C12]
MRQRAAHGLLVLFDADYFASYVWDADRARFDGRVTLNMDPANLSRYEAYYQYRDPITPKLQRRRRATPVTAIMPQRELMKTEFFNDFLRPDGLHHGMNLYAYDGELNIGDLRIWRARHRAPFDDADVALLDYLRPFFTNVMRNVRAHAIGAPHAREAGPPASAPTLTARESEVLARVLQGQTDKAIARALGISFATVRTHINRLFRKFGVANRTELVCRARDV